MTKFTGWDPEQIRPHTPAVGEAETHSLTQAIEEAGIFEDEPLRLIYELLKLLNKGDSDLHKNMDFRNMIPKIMSAVGSVVDETDKRAILKSILIPIMDRADISAIKTKGGKVDFLDFLVKTIHLRAFVKAILSSADIQLTHSLAGSSAAEAESNVDDDLEDTFETLLLPSALEDISYREEDIARLEQVLTTSIQEKSSELAAAIFKQLQIQLDSRITVVEFTLTDKVLEETDYGVADIAPENPVEVLSRYKYSDSPIPKVVLVAARDKFCKKTGAKEFQYFQSLVRAAVDQTKSLPETVLETLSQHISLFSHVQSWALQKQATVAEIANEVLSAVIPIFDNAADLEDFVEDVRLVFLNFDWMILPIARYAMQQATQNNAPLEVLRNSKTLALEVDANLDDFFEFALSTIVAPTKFLSKSSTEFSGSPKALSNELPNPMLLVLHESVHLGYQVLNRAENRLKQRPKSYNSVLQKLIDSYRNAIGILAERLNLSPEFDSMVGAVCGPYNFLNYCSKKTHQRYRPWQKIYVPMSYGSEAILENANNDNDAGIRLPYFVDLSYWLPPVGTGQGNLPTCTAYVVKTVVEFLHRQKEGEEPFTVSASFLYKLTLDRKKERRSDSSAGLSGTSIRDTIQTLVELGVPQDKDWPYPAEDESDDERERLIATPPPSACYFAARKFKINKYLQIDQDTRMSRPALLAQIKAILASGLPCIFALKAMEALRQTNDDKKGRIPYLSETETDPASGHALVAVGYDDTFAIGNNQGALLVRNSWGPEWGNQGYGWLPYQYVLDQNVLDQSVRVVDCWVLLEWEWTKEGKFGLSPEGWRDNIAAPVPPGETR